MPNLSLTRGIGERIVIVDTKAKNREALARELEGLFFRVEDHDKRLLSQVIETLRSDPKTLEIAVTKFKGWEEPKVQLSIQAPPSLRIFREEQLDETFFQENPHLDRPKVR